MSASTRERARVSAGDLEAVVARAAGFEDGPVHVAADVLSDKVGRRRTIRYRVVGPNRRTTTVIGKAYARRRAAVHAYRRSRALHSHVALRLKDAAIPAPLAVSAGLGVALFEDASGSDLRHAVFAGDERPVRAAARWLARLHEAAPVAGLRAKSAEHELAKVDAWSERLRDVLSAPHVHLLRARLTPLADSVRQAAPTVIHRDFYYANLLWDGVRVWVLDLDQASLGDPAHDVAHFGAQLQKLAWLETADARSLAAAETVFVEQYAEEAQLPSRERLSFFRAYALLKLASTELERPSPGWRERAQLYGSLAVGEADAA